MNKYFDKLISVPSMSPQDLQAWCNEYLDAQSFKDYCPNGLQVDADTPISKIVTGVTACAALIDAACQLQAQAILVHHGYFWKGEPAPITGMKGARIRKLMQNGISLLAYHLPLDAHPIVGNNALLAKQLGLTITGALYPEEKHPVGNITTADTSSVALFEKIKTDLQRTPLWIPANSQSIKPNHLDYTQYLLDNCLNDYDRPLTKIAICSGGAQDMIEQAAYMGCDAYISGEISERTTHSARELGLDYFACGHHATEIRGIKALGKLIATELNLEVQFVDIANPA